MRRALVTGRFDPERQRAVWPSTGNYARGGIAISRVLGCRGVAVLPEGMSRERFDWLDSWVVGPEDIVRTPGSESNVKEIYDECNRLAADPGCVVLNQFCEFGNYLAHRSVTGPALERVFDVHREHAPRARLAAFVAASGSSGTLAAGDHLAARRGARVVGVEALECPTMLYNGFGEHNIQGIGDKHIPLIHNVMAMDAVTAVSDRATDELSAVYASDEGRELLRSRGVDDETIAALDSFGLSSICNVIASIKTAKHFGLGPDDIVLTVATDGAQLYGSERARIIEERFGGRIDRAVADESLRRHVENIDTDDYLALDDVDRRRIFNLGYFTWVEQQGIPLDVFQARRSPSFWDDLVPLVDHWDEMIRAVNDETEVEPGP
ncbi:MAG: pyridoxal-phosphate dependent enzyme [Acidimicrobiia bacterium]|nr:pyridoxal-phosphate dependent enzyme [Acidimicrobiia bacterium]